MKKINMTYYQLDKLKRFYPKTNIINTEAKLYYYDNNRILKLFYNMDENKMYTLQMINKYKKDINIDELFLDFDLALISNKVIATISDYIDGNNLSKVLYSPQILLKDKINILIKIGKVLEKIRKVRSSIISDFYIGDLYEDNILLTNDGNIKIMDMDSCKINNNKAYPSKYLTRLSRRKKFNKKYVVDKRCPHIIIPNENTDNYCYNMIILNTLYQGDISKLKIQDFHKYLYYLDSIGISKELVKNFCTMYNEEDTKNLYYLLDDLSNKHQAHRNIYKIKKDYLK